MDIYAVWSCFQNCSEFYVGIIPPKMKIVELISSIYSLAELHNLYSNSANIFLPSHVQVIKAINVAMVRYRNAKVCRYSLLKKKKNLSLTGKQGRIGRTFMRTPFAAFTCRIYHRSNSLLRDTLYNWSSPNKSSPTFPIIYYFCVHVTATRTSEFDQQKSS